MLQVIAAVFTLLLSPGDAPAQTAPDRPAAGINRETGTPGSAGPKDDGVVQRGTQPNAGEVRPGNRDGDQPSASAGELQPRTVRRIFGLPVTAALIICAVIIAIVALATTLSAQSALAQPGRTPDDVLPVIERSKDEPKSKSDGQRLVGKVLAVDKQRGTVKLSTDTEGVRDVKPHTALLNAVRVGDMISVARSGDDAVSASPR